MLTDEQKRILREHYNVPDGMIHNYFKTPRFIPLKAEREITFRELEIMHMLTEQEKELWLRYQNDVAKPISEMTADELQAFIDQCESTIFEAKAKQSKAIAEKNNRKAEAAKLGRDKLIGNPRYSPPDSPSALKSPGIAAKEKKAAGPKAKKPSLFSLEDLAEAFESARKKAEEKKTVETKAETE